jgi:ABC-type transport system involved in multi-copper enzyme maturation permease subunit
MMPRGQFNALLAKELRSQIFNPLVLKVIAVMLILVALATVRSTDAYKWNREQYTALQAPAEESPLANVGASAAAEPQPLHVLARGVSDIMSRTVGAMRQLEAGFNIKYSVGLERRQKELIYALVPDVDPMMVLRYLLAVLALVLSYNQVCGERQSGTLKQMLANHLSRRKILTAKLVAGLLTLAFMLALVLLLILAILWALNVSITTADYWRIGFLMLATYLYGVVFLAIGLTVSSLARTGSVAILICLAVWCLLVIVAPGLTAQIAEAFSPAPPAQQAYMEKLAIERNMKGGEVLRGEAEKLREANRQALDAIGSVDRDFLNQVRRQESLAQILGLFSPATAFESVATTFAGTGIAEEHELIRQLNAYFRQISDYDDIEPVLMQRTKPDDLPKFTYQPLSASALMQASLAQWSALIAAGIILLGAAFMLFNRYDVR